MDSKRDSFFQKKKQQDFNGKAPDKNSDSKKKQIKKDFDKNRDIRETGQDDKKPFDKKTYRLKKYSKKYKLEQWEEQRKKKLLHEYQKTLKNDPLVGKYRPRAFDDEVDATAQAGQFVRHPDLIAAQNDQPNKKKDPFLRAKEQFNKVKQQKQEKKEQLERAKVERQKKLQEYKKKKHDRFKKLSKKNKKGQPVMTGRLELLLEKIQNG